MPYSNGLESELGFPFVCLCLALLIVLMISVVLDPYIHRRQRKTMLVIIALALSLVFQNYLEWRLVLQPAGRQVIRMRLAASVYGYVVRPFLLLLFLYLVDPEHRHPAAWILALFNLVVYGSAFFCRLSFWIDSANHYHRGPLSFTCAYVSAALLLKLLQVTVRNYRPENRGEIWLPVSVVAFIAVSVFMDYRVSGEIQVVSFLTVSVAGSCIFYYIWLHLRFVREHERDLIAGAQLRMMLTQIRPHFLYNCLTAIEELCESDPKGAREAVSKFAGYLRGNMESLTRERSIPFTEEFAHTKLYLELEQMRFEDDLKLRFDIECTDFFIPALTLEPLAENAVRHGIRGREDGAGTVAITSREYPDRYEISVTDNGPGFDPSQLTDDGKTHIGIANVRERLKLLCQGRLQIDFPDEGGTRATIILPKKELQETDV